MTKDGKMKEYYNKIQEETEKLVDEYEIKKKIKNLEEEIKHQEDIIANNRDNTKTHRPINEAEKKIEQLKKQIRGLKTMNITKDCMEILRLSGFQVNDAYTKDYNFEDPKVIEAVIKKLEKEAKEGKFVDPNYLAGVKRALEMAKRERAKDACEKIFTKGTDDALFPASKYDDEIHKLELEYQNISRSSDNPSETLKKMVNIEKKIQYLKELRRKEQGMLSKDACEKIFTKGEAEDDSPEEELIKYAEKTKDPEYIAHVKGLKNPNTINARLQAHRQGKDGDIILPQHKCSDDDATENGSIEEFGKNKDIEKMSPEKDPTLAQDASYPVVHREGDFKIVESDEGFELYFRGVYYDTYHTKEQAIKFIEKYKERAKARGIKDSDPKVAEANAIISLCGGVM